MNGRSCAIITTIQAQIQHRKYIFPVLLSTKMREDNKKGNPLTMPRKHTNWKGKYYEILSGNWWLRFFGEIEGKIKINAGKSGSINTKQHCNSHHFSMIFLSIFSVSLHAHSTHWNTDIQMSLILVIYIFFPVILDQQCRTLMYTQNIHTPEWKATKKKYAVVDVPNCE